MSSGIWVKSWLIWCFSEAGKTKRSKLHFPTFLILTCIPSKPCSLHCFFRAFLPELSICKLLAAWAMGWQEKMDEASHNTGRETKTGYRISQNVVLWSKNVINERQVVWILTFSAWPNFIRRAGLEKREGDLFDQYCHHFCLAGSLLRDLVLPPIGDTQIWARDILLFVHTSNPRAPY